MKTSFAVLAGLCFLAPSAFAAPAAKPAKPVVQKQAAQKPAPKTAKPANTSQEPPPGVRTQASPAPASAPAAKPAAAKKAAAEKTPKKKQVAKKKGGVQSGRAAASASPMDSVDKNQLATDHLQDAQTKSPVDLLTSYKEVLADGDLETAAVLLRLATNEEPNHQLITRVHDLLGIKLDTQDTEVLLEIARTSRAEAVVDGVTAKDSKSSPVDARIASAHAAAERATPRSIEALAIYKRAVSENNKEAAALALQGVVKGPVDEAAIAKTNALLALDGGVPVEQLAAQP